MDAPALNEFLVEQVKLSLLNSFTDSAKEAQIVVCVMSASIGTEVSQSDEQEYYRGKKQLTFLVGCEPTFRGHSIDD